MSVYLGKSAGTQAKAESAPWPVGTDSNVLHGLFRNDLHAFHFALMVDDSIPYGETFDPYHGLGER